MVSTKEVFSGAVLIALPLLLVTAAAADLGDGPCVSFSHRDQTACGSTVDSSQGQGAVELCGDCYPCGYDDLVCPYDFVVDGVQGDCLLCPDPNCQVHIEGYAKNSRDGNGINYVHIETDLRHIQPPNTTETDINLGNGLWGYYSFSVPRGRYNFIATATGYAPKLAPFNSEEPPVSTGGMFNFTMVPSGSCTADCTYEPLFEKDLETGETKPTYTLCNPDCEGYSDEGGACSFPAGVFPEPPETLPAGNSIGSSNINYDMAVNCTYDPATGKRRYIPAGYSIYFGRVNATHVVRGQCCEGAPHYEVALTSWFSTDKKNVVPQSFSGELTDNKGTITGFGKLNLITYN
ncbi:hypothetical protein JXA12_00145 [Candidatus Woesearchaeota archaeon]|nr:hypothetical protein [Candidatus Woesearchaeota archaeon]